MYLYNDADINLFFNDYPNNDSTMFLNDAPKLLYTHIIDNIKCLLGATMKEQENKSESIFGKI